MSDCIGSNSINYIGNMPYKGIQVGSCYRIDKRQYFKVFQKGGLDASCGQVYLVGQLLQVSNFNDYKNISIIEDNTLWLSCFYKDDTLYVRTIEEIPMEDYEKIKKCFEVCLDAIRPIVRKLQKSPFK